MRLSTLFTALACFLIIPGHAASAQDPSRIKETVDNAIQSVMQTYKIPGMAVAVSVNGKRYFYNYGVTSRDTKHPVTNETLFEIGSISKTLTATLATYAQAEGKLSLSDSPGKYLPSLQGSSLDQVTLLHLGTHTAGGLPLQVPDHISNADQLIDYFKTWQPAYPAGTHRMYSNPSIGLLGMVAAKSLQEPFEEAIEKKLFPALGMTHSYLHVPATQMKNYAQGYTRKDAPMRLNPGVLASEAYAVRSSTTDMISFLEANMQITKLDEKLQRAIADTHKGYFQSGEMVQGLIWERYPYPVELQQVLAGNADTMVYHPNATSRLDPPSQQTNALINKTGSTNGFAAYVAFIPAKKLGIVMLANKNHPVDARVTAAYRILTALDNPPSSK